MRKPDIADRQFPFFGCGGPVAALAMQRQERIRVCAYFRAERRDFAPDHELDDWLAAEREIDEMLRPR